MDTSLFTSFEGRINRAKWWLGIVIMIVVTMILYFIIGMLVGGSIIARMDPANMGPDAIMSATRKMIILQLIVTAIIAYPATALMKKRINDRDRPGWLVYVFWAPTVLSLFLSLTGLGFTTVDVGGVAMPTPSALGWLINIAGLVVFIWLIIELGILKGTEGTNQHGADPLAGA